MSEWWTYRLRDLLLFSPRTYYRLFELYNATIWPAQVLTLASGLAIVPLSRRASAVSGRSIAAILAPFWLWIAIGFHAARYATINTAAVYFAWAFGLEAALLIGTVVVPGGLVFGSPREPAGSAGLAIFLFALLVEPVVGLLLGRGWRQVEIFGVAPDPTAVATLGILLLANVRGRVWLMVIPAVWCGITGTTLLAMKAPDFWIPPVAAALAICLAFWQARTRRRKPAYGTNSTFP